MPCFSPLDAWRNEDGGISFRERGNSGRHLVLPCGQCIGCRLERSRAWAVRCMHEAQMHEANSFVTLTYDDEHIPKSGSLVYGDFQAFMRRVRKRLGKVRFYMCGEYGDTLGRPHYHVLLFGIGFPDRSYLRKLPSGAKLYTSEVLQQLWPLGYSSIGDVTFESAAYVARYICKKVTGDLAAAHYSRVDPHTGELSFLVPEFCHMSLKPGIGAGFLRKFQMDIFPHDYVIVRGMKCKVPKYYSDLLSLSDPVLHEDVLANRELMAQSLELKEDATYARLKVREDVTRARLVFKRRGLES